MPLYFFEIDTGFKVLTDDDGWDLTDLSTVPVEAAGILSDLARNRLLAVDRPMACIVRSETGAAVFKAELSLSAGWLDV